MPLPFANREDLESHGFLGFRPVADLRRTRCRDVPELAGVYTVVRLSPGDPRFMPLSPGGHFKGKDPTVGIETLQKNWVEGTVVLYFGKAGGPNSSATLRKRISSYVRFGAGEAIGHWGGRLIWQLEDQAQLQVAWRPSAAGVPRDEECSLLQAFESGYGRLPFANLTH